MGRSGGDRVTRFLWDRIDTPNAKVEMQVLLSLGLCDYQAEGEQQAGLLQKIEEEVDDAAWSMAAARDLHGEAVTTSLSKILGSEIDQHRDRVFLLLSLIYDSHSIRLVQDRFKSGTAESKVFALELMDVFIAQELKLTILPLFEELSLGERLRQLSGNFPQERLAPLERLKDVVNREFTKVDRWTKAWALKMMPDVDSGKVHHELTAYLFGSDAMLRETAALSVYRTDPAQYKEYAELLLPKDRLAINRIVSAAANGGADTITTIDKVSFLKGVGVFQSIPEMALAALVPVLTEERVEAFTEFLHQGGVADRLYILVEGQVMVHVGQKVIANLLAGEIVGEVATLSHAPRSASVTTTEDSRFFVLQREDLLE